MHLVECRVELLAISMSLNREVIHTHTHTHYDRIKIILRMIRQTDAVTLWPASGRAAMNSRSGASYSSNDRTLLGSTRVPAAPARSMQETRCPAPWSRHASLNQHQAPWQAPCTRTKCSLLALETSPPVSIPIPTPCLLLGVLRVCIYRQGGSRKCASIDYIF